jgi:hypothetical protein
MLTKILDNGCLIIAISCWGLAIVQYINCNELYFITYIILGLISYISNYFEKEIRKIKENK